MMECGRPSGPAPVLPSVSSVLMPPVREDAILCNWALSFSVGSFESYCSFQVLPNGGVVLPLKSRNQIVEFNAQGKRVWEASAPQPTSAVRLPNGHTLVSCRDGQLVVELDRSGRETWQYKSTGYPWRAYQR